MRPAAIHRAWPAAALAGLLAWNSALIPTHAQAPAPPRARTNQTGDPTTAKPAELLALVQRKAFDYFWFEAHPKTGLVKDRAGNARGDDYAVASIAATGFGLAALAVGVERGWVERASGEERALRTLRFIHQHLAHEHGWFYHFIDWKTGQRVWNCEVSSIDSALFIAGALLAGQCFGGEIQAEAQALYARMDFHWMLTDGGARPDERLIGHGWKPESGFLKSRWDQYSEHLLLNLLALGSPTHPVPETCWDAWERNQGEYAGHKTFACGPLFTHQYSQAFVDFRGQRDRLGHDYFDSAVQATLANRQFCIDQAGRWKTYGPNVWGLSACDKPGGGYEAYGAPPGRIVQDGTVAPWATVAAITATPELALEAIGHMHNQYGARLWGRYGFSNGFNVDRDWFAADVIGIDLGAALLLIENHQTGFVWRQFMAIPHIQQAMHKAGFQPAK